MGDIKPEAVDASNVYYGASVFLVLGFAVSVYGAVHFFRPDDSAGLAALREFIGEHKPMANPVRYAIPDKVGSTLVYTTWRRHDVRALMNTEVGSVEGDVVRLRSESLPSKEIIYSGLSSVSVQPGQKLPCGQTIGEFAGDQSLNQPGRFTVEFVTVSAESPLIREGEKLYAKACAGCHELRGVGKIISDGKLRNGRPVTLALLKQMVRKGSGTMPALPEPVLLTHQIDAIGSFLMAKR